MGITTRLLATIKEELKYTQAVIVTRHPATQEFIQRTIELPDDTPVLSTVTPEDVAGKIVFGNIPLSLAAIAARVVVVEFDKPPRGHEYSLQEMHAAGAQLLSYDVSHNYGYLWVEGKGYVRP